MNAHGPKNLSAATPLVTQKTVAATPAVSLQGYISSYSAKTLVRDEPIEHASKEAPI